MRDARDAVKRKRKADADEDEPALSGPLTVGQLTSGIGNKRVRSDKYHQLKRAQDKEKRAERTKRQKAYEEAKEQGLEPPPKAVPKASLRAAVAVACPPMPLCSLPFGLAQTIENTREPDVTAVNPDDEEVAADEDEDEFAGGAPAATARARVARAAQTRYATGCGCASSLSEHEHSGARCRAQRRAPARPSLRRCPQSTSRTCARPTC